MESAALSIEVPLQKVSPSMREQIIIALDGRSFRSISLDVRILEAEYSKKMKGKLKFKKEEIDRLNMRLKSEIIFNEDDFFLKG